MELYLNFDPRKTTQFVDINYIFDIFLTLSFRLQMTKLFGRDLCPV